MVHRRRLDGRTLVFGNQGALWGNAMTWWDHDTGSIWSQPLGESIAGPRKGERLDLYPSSLTTWAAWKDRHPATLALDVFAGSSAYPLDRMVIVVDMGIEAKAYPIDELRRVGVVNDVVGGAPIGVVIDPDDDSRWAVFSRKLDTTEAELEIVGGRLIDKSTDTSFDPFLGLGITGPLAEQSLDRLGAFTAFPSDYRTFYPEGTTWRR